MAKKEKAPRTLICAKTGREFVYAGVGRPPKYHPDVQNEVRAGQRAASVKRKRAEAKQAKAEATNAALAAAA